MIIKNTPCIKIVIFENNYLGISKLRFKYRHNLKESTKNFKLIFMHDYLLFCEICLII